MHVVIIANAPNLDLAPYMHVIRAAKLLIAADGGALPLLRAQVTPQIIVGDLDSVDQASLDALVVRGAAIQRYPREKDETDLELALLLAAKRGATQIDILGALGGRWDHTLANVALLAHPVLYGRRVHLLDERQTLFLVRDKATLNGNVGDTVSLLPLTAEAGGVTTEGLRYGLHNATLRYDQARGISNILMEPPGRVTLREGLLLVVQHNDNGEYQWRGELVQTQSEPVNQQINKPSR